MVIQNLHLLVLRVHAVPVEEDSQKVTITQLNKLVDSVILLPRQIVVPGMMLEEAGCVIQMLTLARLTAIVNTGKTVNFK